MNLPNKLTILRVLLVPVFMVFAALSHFGRSDFSPLLSLLAAVVFSVASITDYLDGHLARKHHLITDFGKFMDPLADKMLTTAALIFMTVDGVCSPIVLAVVLFREFAVAGMRMLAASGQRVIAANMWGKVKTVLQMVTVLLYYFSCGMFPPDGAFLISLVTQILCWLVAAVTLLSGGKYLWDNRDVLSGDK
ncbi:MAG: CDP-diacylglycerol--glycerol-3-phosphate 3-phosphatidyltransferase [Acutalibacter sp.]|nr:CDP-diacylglycerol--glycerol-3-phosphate 3-phosphatidyltransferase [Acutalibacter sp.]